MLRTVVPGTVLKGELDAIGITLSDFARQIDVPPNRVSQIITGKRAITGDTALRLGHWFGSDPLFWLNLQSQYELAQAEIASGVAIRNLPTKAIWPKRSEQPKLF